MKEGQIWIDGSLSDDDMTDPCMKVMDGRCPMKMKPRLKKKSRRRKEQKVDCRWLRILYLGLGAENRSRVLVLVFVN